MVTSKGCSELQTDLLSDDPADEVVVRQDLERNLVRLSGVLRLLLHHLQDLVASVAAVFRLAVDGDGLLHRPDVVLAMNVDASSEQTEETLRETGFEP